MSTCHAPKLSLLFAVLLVLATSAGAARIALGSSARIALGSSALPRPCQTPRFLVPHDVSRHAGGAVGEAHCYRLDARTAGLLLLHATPETTSPSGVRMALLHRAEGAHAATAVATFVDRKITEMRLLAEAGTYFLTLRAEDPRQALPAYRLVSRWIDVDLSVVEPTVRPVAWKTETNGEIELEPETARHLSLLERLCTSDPRRDDHDGTFACATPITHGSVGALASGWEDDVDVFRFELAHWATIALTLTRHGSAADARGALHDTFGRRIGVVENPDASGIGRAVRTLGPGTYFVRIQGSMPGTYALAVDALTDR